MSTSKQYQLESYAFLFHFYMFSKHINENDLFPRMIYSRTNSYA